MLSPDPDKEQEPFKPEEKSPAPDEAPPLEPGAPVRDEPAGPEKPVPSDKPGPGVKKPPPPKPPQKESRTRRFLVRAMRWILGFFIVFGLGIIFTLFVWYNPLRAELRGGDEALNQAQQEINSLEGQITTLENRIDELEALETRNQELQEAVGRAQLHTLILSAQTDVAMAQLALAEEDIPRARVLLNQTPDTLTEIEALVAADQQQLVQDMQSRLELAISELEDQAYAAASDLDVLATSLLELENAYFTRP